MQDNLFSSIVDNDKLVSKYRLAPPDLKHLSSSTEYNNPPAGNGASDVETNATDTEHQINQQQQQKYSQKSAVSLPRYRICIDSVDKVAEASMLKSSFIVYRVRFSRVSDLQSHATWKRFKEMNTWFLELQQKHPPLSLSTTIKFPTATDSWISGNSSDPMSEFVLKRKLDLEVFFKSLFAEFPILVRHPHVMDFFELGSLAPETMSVVATRVAARDLQQASAGASDSSKSGVALSGSSSSKQDISWYTYDKSIMEDILSRDTMYDERTARVVKKSDGSSSKRSFDNSPSVVEIMHCTDELNRLALRQDNR